MDSQLRQLYRNAKQGDIAALRSYAAAVLRLGGKETLDLYFAQPIVNEIHAELQNFIVFSPESVRVGSFGDSNSQSIDEIIEAIESSALDELLNKFNINPATSPADRDPTVCYLGWIQTDRTYLGAFTQPKNEPALVAVFSTLRQAPSGLTRLNFFYGVYAIHNQEITMIDAWNYATAPAEYPPTIETITNNHSGILHLMDRLQECHAEAEIRLRNTTQGAFICQFCGIDFMRDENQVSYHIDDDGEIDHGADADHTPY